MLAEPSHKPKRPDTVEFHSRAVERVITTIRGHLDETISLGEMAAVAYMSKYHFNRTFRQVTGVPPRRFLSALRIEAATWMLLNTDHKVTDICLDVGYSSLGTFIRRFSGMLGISPLKLRTLGHAPAKSLPQGERDDEGDGKGSDSGTVSTVAGRIQVPSCFSGPIFVGLFRTPIPEGAPVACAISRFSGSYSLGPVPQGNYYLLAVGIPGPVKMNDYFSHGSALRGGGELVSVRDHRVECQDICLRAAMPTDPPILVNLPVLLSKIMPGANVHEQVPQESADCG
jgi:AraC family transcriptional regulator